MSQGSLAEVFTLNEVARAAGVPTDAVRTLLGRGELSFIPGTRFINVANPARTARRLRDIALTLHSQPATALFEPAAVRRETRKPVFLSLAAHAAVALLLVVLSIQSCCWSNCPIPEKSAVEWHTGHGDSSG